VLKARGVGERAVPDALSRSSDPANGATAVTFSAESNAEGHAADAAGGHARP
jgi:hypothetical protein